MKIIYFSLIVLFLASCGTADKDILLSYDLTPPKLIDVKTDDPDKLVLTFDEVITAEENSFSSDQELLLESSQTDSTRLSLNFTSPMNPGEKYNCRISVLDDKKNSVSLMVVFYGFNPEEPRLVINEFNPRGSGNSPDCIELYVGKGGLMGGTALTLGSLTENTGMYIFPNFRVATGEYIILHCKPEGSEAEKDEFTDKGSSGGLLAHQDAWDLWWKESPGIPGNNGVLCLWTNPSGTLHDMVIYTDRITDVNDEYLGWTSSIYVILQTLQNGWEWIFSGDFPTPDDSVQAGTSTATRSICRNSASFDDNNRADWHIVPTSMKSFGTANTDEIY